MNEECRTSYTHDATMGWSCLMYWSADFDKCSGSWFYVLNWYADQLTWGLFCKYAFRVFYKVPPPLLFRIAWFVKFTNHDTRFHLFCTPVSCGILQNKRENKQSRVFCFVFGLPVSIGLNGTLLHYVIIRIHRSYSYHTDSWSTPYSETVLKYDSNVDGVRMMTKYTC